MVPENKLGLTDSAELAREEERISNIMLNFWGWILCISNSGKCKTKILPYS